jgi:hypothetical protein
MHLNEFLGTNFNMLSIGNEIYSSSYCFKNPKCYLLGHDALWSCRVDWLFGRMYCLHLQGESVSWSIKQASSKQQSYFHIVIHLDILVNSATVDVLFLASSPQFFFISEFIIICRICNKYICSISTGSWMSYA